MTLTYTTHSSLPLFLTLPFFVVGPSSSQLICARGARNLIQNVLHVLRTQIRSYTLFYVQYLRKWVLHLTFRLILRSYVVKKKAYMYRPKNYKDLTKLMMIMTLSLFCIHNFDNTFHLNGYYIYIHITRLINNNIIIECENKTLIPHKLDLIYNGKS